MSKSDVVNRLLSEVCLTRPVGFQSRTGNPVFVYDEAFISYSIGKLLTLLEALDVIQEKGSSVKSDAIRSEISDCFWGNHIHDYNHSMCREDYEAMINPPVVVDAELIKEIKKI